MALNSMTGFARAEGGAVGWQWSWELKSVNGRNLELRLRLPQGHDALEGDVRKRIQAKLTRGSVYGVLAVSRDAATSEVRINEDALNQVLKAVEELKARTEIAPPTADGLLGLRGVLEVSEPVEEESAREAREIAMLGTLDEALEALVAARADEGAKLHDVMSGQVAEIGRLSNAAEACAAARPGALKTRITEQVEALMASGKSFDETRLHQELALMATKMDVREEIDRLSAHVTAAQELLAASAPVGRKFDFLTQEFNREANTICSKAGDIELTQIGLDLKAVIDQLREQVQNVE